MSEEAKSEATIREQLQTVVRNALRNTGHDTEEVLFLGEQLAEATLQMTEDQLVGRDVSVARKALIASTKNLAAATSLSIAYGVLGVIQSTLRAIVHVAVRTAFESLA